MANKTGSIDVIEGLVMVGEKCLEWQEQEENLRRAREKEADDKRKEKILAKGLKYFGQNLLKYLELDECSSNEVFEKNGYFFKNLPRMVPIYLHFDLSDPDHPKQVFMLPDANGEYSRLSRTVSDIGRAFALARRIYVREEARIAEKAASLKELKYENIPDYVVSDFLTEEQIKSVLSAIQIVVKSQG